MISRGSVITDQLFGYVETESPVEHLFFKYARWCFKQCRRACEEALENLLAAVDERRTFEILKAFNYLYQVRLDAHKRILLGDVRAGGEVEKLPKNCVMIRKVGGTFWKGEFYRETKGQPRTGLLNGIEPFPGFLKV